MEMEWSEISQPTNIDYISITFSNVRICVRDSDLVNLVIALST